jgi:hypothetical protein
MCCLCRPAYTYCYVLRRWVVGNSCVIAHRCPFKHLVGWFAPNLSTVRKQPVLWRVGDTNPSRFAVLEFYLQVSSLPELFRGPCDMFRDIMSIHGICKQFNVGPTEFVWWESLGNFFIVSMVVESQNPADIFRCRGLRYTLQFGFGGSVTLAGNMALHVAVIAGKYLTVSSFHITPVCGSGSWRRW